MCFFSSLNSCAIWIGDISIKFTLEQYHSISAHVPVMAATEVK
jgi:hypothetical protein